MSAHHNGIGNDELLRFIDEINDLRAASGNRFRFRPYQVSKGVIGMEEYFAIARPTNPERRSERFS